MKFGSMHRSVSDKKTTAVYSGSRSNTYNVIGYDGTIGTGTGEAGRNRKLFIDHQQRNHDSESAGWRCIMAVLSRKYYKTGEKKKTYRKEEVIRLNLRSKRKEIEGCREYNRRIWNVDYYPGIEEMLGYVERKNRRIWEKSPADQDFLSVRLGIGERSSELLGKSYRKNHFCLEDDALLETGNSAGKRKSAAVRSSNCTFPSRQEDGLELSADKRKINKLIWMHDYRNCRYACAG